MRRQALLLLFLAAGPARAQTAQRPVVVPQHDVDVTYAVPLPDPAAPPLVQRMRFSGATMMQRIDPPGGDLAMITDYRARRLIVLRPAERRAAVLPAPGQAPAPGGVATGGSYRRLGEQSIAGTACTEWETADVAGRDSVVCLTADGVMLRAAQDGHVLLQAVRVDRGPQPAALFAVPAGFAVQMPPATPPTDGTP